MTKNAANANTTTQSRESARALTTSMNYVVVSMYTENTPYEREVEKLRESLHEFGLRHKIYAAQNTGSWEKNCQQKAYYIRQAFDEFSTNIVWLDADAVLASHPVLFDSLDCDLAYHFLSRTRELLSGTLWLAQNDRAKALVDAWIATNATNRRWDQKNLQQVVSSAKDLRVQLLPESYCKIHDLRPVSSDPPVVVHYQASRRFKESINKHVA